MVIFDTSLLIDVTKNQKYVLDLIESYSVRERIATTIVTKYELLRGATTRNIDFILEMLNQFVILDFGEEALNEAVEAYQHMKEKGELLSELDFLIAGIAAANNETLITRDKDFSNLGSSKIVVLE
jgi:tRNA(fMet)-specific endonuclease VapC